MSRLRRHEIEVPIMVRRIQKADRPIKSERLSPLFKQLTKGKYRMVFDESYYHEPSVALEDQQWYEQITCRGGGFVYLLSEKDKLLAFFAPNGKIANLLLASVPEAKMHLNCVTEAVISFPFDKLQSVNKVVHFRRKKIIANELREAARKRLTEYHEKHAFKNNSDTKNDQG